jgi:hypothetical protein
MTERVPRMECGICALLVLGMLTCSTATVAADSVLPPNEVLVQAFLEAALESHTNHVYKWPVETEVRVEELTVPEGKATERAPYVIRTVSEALQNIGSATALEIEFPARSSRPDVLVVIGSLPITEGMQNFANDITSILGPDFSHEETQSGCYAQVTIRRSAFKGGSQISGAVVFVSTDLSDQDLRRCIDSKLLIAFGLVGPAHLERIPGMEHHDVSQVALELLRGLYSKDVLSGASRSDAVEEFKHYLAEQGI